MSPEQFDDFADLVARMRAIQKVRDVKGGNTQVNRAACAVSEAIVDDRLARLGISLRKAAPLPDEDDEDDDKTAVKEEKPVAEPAPQEDDEDEDDKPAPPKNRK